MDATAILVGLGAWALSMFALVAVFALKQRRRMSIAATRGHHLVGHFITVDGQTRRITKVKGNTITYDMPFLDLDGRPDLRTILQPLCQKCGAPLVRFEEVWCARCISNVAGGPR